MSSSSPVVGLRPEVEAVRHLHELRRDPHLAPRLAHAPLEQRRHVELLADDPQVLVLALELEGRRATRDPQLRDLGQDVQQLLGQAVGEVLLVLAGAHVHEGQDRDRRRAGRCRSFRLPSRTPGLAAEPNGSRQRQDQGGGTRADPPARATTACSPRPPRRSLAVIRPAVVSRRKPLQVRPHVRSALVAQAPVLLHRLRDDPLQLHRDLPVQPHRRHRLPVEDRLQDLPRALAREGQHPRRHLVEHRPERVEVRPRVQLLPPRLLRRHVGHRPHQRPRTGQLLGTARRRPAAVSTRASPASSAWPGRSPGASPAPAPSRRCSRA